MKVALLLSGQPRYIKQYADGIINNLIAPNNADVFVHCWAPQVKVPFRAGEGWKDERLAENAIEQILRIYRPTALKYEPQIDFADRKLFPIEVDFTRTLAANMGGGAEKPEIAEYYRYATLSMWYSIMEAGKLVSPQVELGGTCPYDCIIKARFDLGIQKRVCVADYDLSKVWAEEIGGRPELLNNWFNFGGLTAMQPIMSIYDRISDLYGITGIWCNEYWAKKVCDDNNIGIGFDSFGLSIPSRNL